VQNKKQRQRHHDISLSAIECDPRELIKQELGLGMLYYNVMPTTMPMSMPPKKRIAKKTLKVPSLPHFPKDTQA